MTRPDFLFHTFQGERERSFQTTLTAHCAFTYTCISMDINNLIRCMQKIHIFTVNKYFDPNKIIIKWSLHYHGLFMKLETINFEFLRNSGPPHCAFTCILMDINNLTRCVQKIHFFTINMVKINKSTPPFPRKKSLSNGRSLIMALMKLT